MSAGKPDDMTVILNLATLVLVYSGAFAAADGGSNWGANCSRHACTHAGHIGTHQGPDSDPEHGTQHVCIALLRRARLSHSPVICRTITPISGAFAAAHNPWCHACAHSAGYSGPFEKSLTSTKHGKLNLPQLYPIYTPANYGHASCIPIGAEQGTFHRTDHVPYSRANKSGARAY